MTLTHSTDNTMNFKRMALLLLLTACPSRQMPEAVFPNVTVVELTPPGLPRYLWQTRIENEKVTCWIVTGSGSAIHCLSDAQRMERF